MTQYRPEWFRPDLLAGLTAGATLSMLVGLILAIAAVLRLGFVANFISEPVLTGFKYGIGVVILVDQLPKLLGFHIPPTDRQASRQ